MPKDRDATDGTFLPLALLERRLTSFAVHNLKIEISARTFLRDETLRPEDRTAARRIREDARAMMRLLLDVVDVGRASQSRLVPRTSTVQTRPFFDDVVDAFVVRAADRELRLEPVSETVSFHADRELARRVLENLVENAIRHAPARSTIRLRAERVDGGNALSVSDEGIGLDPDALETGAAVGRGIGLTFCRCVLDAHGGSLRIGAGPGTLVCATFPDA